ncbi:MAG: hypothetical protein QW806_09235 [Nitrososphaerota archaeon]
MNMLMQFQDIVENIDYSYIEDLNLELPLELPKVFESEKEQTRIYKKIESTIRSSYEYNKFLSHIKSELNITRCVITKEDLEEVKIEFHHFPLTLYELVDIVYTTFAEKNNLFSSFDVAKEVMKLHYNKVVGLIPLTKTLHEKAHSSNIYFPKQFILFNFEKILSMDYIVKDEYKIKITRAANTTVDEFLERCKTILWPT